MPEDRKHHHSTEQPRAQGGQWREPAGTFDHAGKVPPSPPRYGEMPVLLEAKTQLIAAQANGTLATEVDRINADIARAMALPAHLVKP